MKNLDYTPITNSAQFFPKKGTLAFLQLAFQEGFAELIKSLIGLTYNTSTIYVLRGVINTGTYPTYIISEGVVFYNGEFFLLDATSFTASGINVAVFSIIQTQFTTDADPVTFSDSTVHNIHNIRKMQLTGAASGSGLADILSAFYMNFNIPAQLNLTGTGQVIISGGYPNLNVDVPVSTNLNPVLAAGSNNVGDISYDLDVNVTFVTPLLTSSYYIMGSIISNGTPSNDTTINFSIRNRTTTGFTVHFRENFPAIQNFAFEWIAFAK